MQSARRGIALCSLPLATLAVGAAAAIALGSDDSGVKGRVVPCGIVLERPAPCAVDPEAAAKVVISRHGHVVRRAKVRADGTFRARLGAGRYSLQARAGGSRGPRRNATVSEGRWTTVTLTAGRISPPRLR